MPTYTYFCNKCSDIFELLFSIRDYKEEVRCDRCGSFCGRSYKDDIGTINSSVKKTDSELKTIGDLANRNRDRMSDDHIAFLNKKHNDYKDQETSKPLPKGMSRIQKPKHKIKWR
jgi:putative FmdB family regulatory protein